MVHWNKSTTNVNKWILDYSSDSMRVYVNFKMCFSCHRLISSCHSTATLFGYQSCQGPEPFICVDSWICSWFVLYWWTHSRGCVVSTHAWGLETLCFNWSGLQAVLSELWWALKVNLHMELVYYILLYNYLHEVYYDKPYILRQKFMFPDS